MLLILVVVAVLSPPTTLAKKEFHEAIVADGAAKKPVLLPEPNKMEVSPGRMLLGPIRIELSSPPTA